MSSPFDAHLEEYKKKAAMIEGVAFGQLVAWISQQVTLSEDDVNRLASMVEQCKLAGAATPAPEVVFNNDSTMEALENIKKNQELKTILQWTYTNRKIDAIKAVRQVSGIGLKEAKDLVESLT